MGLPWRLILCAVVFLALLPLSGETDHAYGRLSLLPPLIAVATAILFRRILLALLLGIFVGALVFDYHQAGAARPGVALWETLHAHVLGVLVQWNQAGRAEIQWGHAQILIFTLMMGAMVGVLHRSAGMHGLVDLLSPWARDRRRGQLTTWLLGMVVFFDDYANTVLLGHTMRPVTDRLKISREKLAYLVDSTAAPVAGLAIVSTWVATEVSYIEEGLQAAGLQGDAYSMFLASIPYRFYVLWALLFGLLVAITGRDFGPMLDAERRAARATDDDDAKKDASEDQTLLPDQKVPRRWFNAVIPVGVVVAVVLGMLWWTGMTGVAEENLPVTLSNVLGFSNANLALVVGSASGMLVAGALVLPQRLLTIPQTILALARGAKLMIPGLAVLVLAWGLSGITGDGYLDAGGYLKELLQGRIAPEWMPTIVFLLAAGVSFATGTSWGTMGILVPPSIAVTYRLTVEAGGGLPADHPLMLATVGGVLAGSIFGDHCSPISDTTVLSSQSSGCDHLAHVNTQIWYAITVAVAAVFCGTLPAPYVPVGVLLLIGSVAL
ncbi:MAG: hypothetical protein N2C14_15730, partial [Planctomycetales bacterium]